MCAICVRIQNICRKHRREQQRINEGRFYTLGERIARGCA
jgi:hypothetical protein